MMNTELIELLREVRPNYGDVGSRDVDVTRRQKAIDRAIQILETGEQFDPTSGMTLLTPVIKAKDAMMERGIQYAQFREMFPQFLAAYDAKGK
jgi:hypothetical protein